MERDPDLIAERVAAGELPPGELENASARIAELEDSNADILDRYPPSIMGPAIRRRLEREERQEECFPWWSRFAVGIPVAVAAALLMVVMPLTQHMSSIDTIRTKGEAQLVLQRAQAGEQREQLNSASVAAPGDRIVIGYRVTGSGEDKVYGVVLSVDGAGTVTTHFPERGAAPGLELNSLQALPHSYELDDAPSFERFFLVTRPVPFDVDPVLAAARKLAAEPERNRKDLELPASYSQSSIILRKE
ncbi:MAG: ActD-like protein [Myxococcota bacterium]